MKIDERLKILNKYAAAADDVVLTENDEKFYVEKYSELLNSLGFKNGSDVRFQIEEIRFASRICSAIKILAYDSDGSKASDVKQQIYKIIPQAEMQRMKDYNFSALAAINQNGANKLATSFKLLTDFCL